MNRGFIFIQNTPQLKGTWGFLNIGILRISCCQDGNKLSPTKVQTDETLFGLETPLEKS